MEKKKKNQIKTILYIVLILLLIAGNIYIYVKNHTEPKEIVKETNTIEVNEAYQFSSDEEIEKTMKNKISKMGERSRMQTYIGEFMAYITQGNYEKAYSYLNDSFKENYFKTVDDFKEYVIKEFPSIITTQYTDIERRGEYYILTVDISDALDANYVTITRRFVVKEYGNNDFKISFQTKEDES